MAQNLKFLGYSTQRCTLLSRDFDIGTGSGFARRWYATFSTKFSNQFSGRICSQIGQGKKQTLQQNQRRCCLSGERHRL